MNYFLTFLLCVIGCFSDVCTRAAPPANDHFENRISLGRTNIIFSGTLNEATEECCLLPHDGDSNVAETDVWWSWVATDNSHTVIDVLWLGTNLPAAQIVVYSGTNFNELWPQAWNQLDGLPLRHCVFWANAGQEYQIRVLGQADKFTLRLKTAPRPIFLMTPENVSLTAGSNLVLMTFATELPGTFWPRYQWRKYGVDIAGATDRFLLLTNVTPSDSAAYSIRTRTPYGTNTSSIAQVTVTDHVSPRLYMTRTNEIAISGHTGRSYLVTTSTNLPSWEFEPASAFASGPRRVITLFPGWNYFKINRDTPHRLYRLTEYTPANDLCNVRLKVVRYIKTLWAVQNQRVLSDIPTEPDLYPYVPDGSFLTCPVGGDYVLNAVGQRPECSVPGHDLEEPFQGAANPLDATRDPR